MPSTPAWSSRALVIPFSHAALAACVLVAWPEPAAAQDGGGSRAGSLTASIGASISYSETRGEGSSGVPSNGEFVTQISPGLRWSSRAGRVQGSASYDLNLVNYSKQRNADSVQHALAAALTAEVIDDRGFIDASASISQQSISPFGIQAVGAGSQAQSNRTEVATASISPYLRGSLGGWANYSARVSASGTRAADQPSSDSSSASALLSLTSPSSGARLGWGLDASSQQVDFGTRGKTQTDRVNLSLFLRPISELQLNVSGGQESTDVIGFERRTYDNWGGGVRWTPGPRTNLALQVERRYFGNSHNFVFSHRMRQTVWQYTDIRGANLGSDPNGLGQPITLFALYDALFTSVQPNPAARQLLVQDFLRNIGRQPGEFVAGGGLLTNAASNQRRQDLSFAINGVRTSFTLLAFRSDSRPLDTTTTANGVADLPVKQTGLNSALSYRLTPQSSLSLSATYLVVADSGVQPGNDLASYSLTWSNQPSRNVTTALSGRYSVFDGADSYREAAIVASINYQF